MNPDVGFKGGFSRIQGNFSSDSAFVCRTVVSIAMESPFTARRTRLLGPLGVPRRSAARAPSDSYTCWPAGSPSFRSMRFRQASVSGEVKNLTRFAST